MSGRHDCDLVDLNQFRQQREQERRKLDPKRLALVKEIAQHHPEWGPKEIEKLHRELDDWGE